MPSKAFTDRGGPATALSPWQAQSEATQKTTHAVLDVSQPGHQCTTRCEQVTLLAGIHRLDVNRTEQAQPQQLRDTARILAVLCGRPRWMQQFS